MLQALIYQPTGAIVAAPTTSLPEVLGGELTSTSASPGCGTPPSPSTPSGWPRPDEAERNFAWMARAGAGAQHDGDVQIMVGVEGERDLTEHEREHVRGYRGSRPVRVGNAAWSQTQLDMYGEVLASAQVLRDQIGGMGDAVRDFLCTLADALGAGPERRAACRRERVRAAVLERGWCEEAGARRVFEAVCARANDVGLLSEEVDPADGRLLGNFPQGFSHVGLITAAWSIDQASR